MKQKDFTKTAKILFAIVAAVHLLRAVMGWEVMIHDMMVPVWFSYVVAGLFGYLAYSGHKLLK